MTNSTASTSTTGSPRPLTPARFLNARDDFATRKVPFQGKRKGRDFSVLSTGVVTSIFVFALGGASATGYGLGTTVIMGIFGFLIGFVCASVVAWNASGASMGVDLLSRGAGFGYRGSGLNVLFLAISWIAYAAFECSFIASAIHTQWPAVPLWVLYLVCAFVIVPLTWRGVSQVAWLQKLTVPLFFIGVITLVIRALNEPAVAELPTGISLSGLVQAAALPLSVVPILSLALGDYGRFVKKSDRRWAIPVGAGLMMTLWAGEFIAGGLITSYLGSINPGQYTVQLLGVSGLLWVLVTQLKIQFANYYGPSLALTNFSTRVFKVHGGQRMFLVLTAAAAFAGSMFNLIDNIGYVAGLIGVMLNGWLSLLVVDFFIRRSGRGRFGIQWVEHRRSYLQAWGKPEVTAMLVVGALGIVVTQLDKPTGYGAILSLVLSWILTPGVAALLHRVPAWNVHGKQTAPIGWNDLHDRREEDPAQLSNELLTCGSCGQLTLRVDAVPTPSLQDDTAIGAICSACDAAGSSRQVPAQT